MGWRATECKFTAESAEPLLVLLRGWVTQIELSGHSHSQCESAANLVETEGSIRAAHAESVAILPALNEVVIVSMSFGRIPSCRHFERTCSTVTDVHRFGRFIMSALSLTSSFRLRPDVFAIVLLPDPSDVGHSG
jgi:hypothetical protein